MSQIDHYDLCDKLYDIKNKFPQFIERSFKIIWKGFCYIVSYFLTPWLGCHFTELFKLYVHWHILIFLWHQVV